MSVDLPVVEAAAAMVVISVIVRVLCVVVVRVDVPAIEAAAVVIAIMVVAGMLRVLPRMLIVSV
jgi:hypothetical protein